MSSSTTFRKASDTRALPETPSVPSFRATTKQQLSEQSPGPKLGPGPGYPLTKTEAEQILYASGFPEDLEDYKSNFINEIVSQSAKLPQNQRRSFQTLLNLAKHPCSIEPLIDPRTGYGKFVSQIKELTEEMKQNKGAGGVNDDLKEVMDRAIDGNVRTISTQLVSGFDFTSPSHFIFDKQGTVIGVAENEVPRYGRMCIPYLKKNEGRLTETEAYIKAKQQLKEYEPIYKQSVKAMSDPYKGSQQGTGKTRKNKKHYKKNRKHKTRRNKH